MRYEGTAAPLAQLAEQLILNQRVAGSSPAGRTRRANQVAVQDLGPGDSMNELPDGKVFTTHEVARIFGVNPGTVVRWIRNGDLGAHKTVGGHNRISRDELVRFLGECRRRGTAPGPVPLTILVIDDDPTVFELIRRDLVEHFVERVRLDWARDGFEGGRKVVEGKPCIVFLDLMMPGLDGFEVCRNIRLDPKARDVEVVALTGYYSEENERRILETGAGLCLSKPLDLVLIRGFVERRLLGYRGRNSGGTLDGQTP
jgi:excisionase family DNA binding protein